MALTQEQKNFIERVGKPAAADMKKSRILASLTTAQAILESGWGKSGLSVKANALFGIKATSAWKGKVYNTKTQECYDGVTFTTIDAAFRAYDSWEESIADHSVFLTVNARYAAVIGERDYKKACRAIHAAGYATDPGYSDKLIQIIELYNLTAYDTAETGGNKRMKITIKETLITKNDCYRCNVNKADSRYSTFQSRGPLGLMLHSVGCNQPSAMVFVNQWNVEKKEIAVHGVIEPNGDVYKCMPWNFRGWHGASGSKGSVNDTHAGFEMTEPASIKYTGGASFVDNDPAKTKAHVLGTYAAAVELFAVICAEYKLDPLKDGVIISHSEGYKRGIASNHGDVEHLWGKFGLTMNQFKQDVKNAMSGTGTGGGTPPATVPATPVTPPKPSTGFKVGDIVQFGGGAVYISSTAPTPAHSRGKSRCKVTLIASGAKNPYHLISEDNGGVHGWVDAIDVSAIGTAAAPFSAYTVRVNKGTNYRKGPGEGYAVAGTINDNGVYTIVEESADANGKKWGKLKSGAGWLSLASTQKI